MHNSGDGSVDWVSQGVRFFGALRKLGKPVWMLEYENEGHQLANFRHKLDFTIRMQQFFDYYLQDSQPPMWMTIGVPK